jgi:hypothetical protein
MTANWDYSFEKFGIQQQCGNDLTMPRYYRIEGLLLPVQHCVDPSFLKKDADSERHQTSRQKRLVQALTQNPPVC